jgi:hypothetical protein
MKVRNRVVAQNADTATWDWLGRATTPLEKFQYYALLGPLRLPSSPNRLSIYRCPQKRPSRFARLSCQPRARAAGCAAHRGQRNPSIATSDRGGAHGPRSVLKTAQYDSIPRTGMRNVFASFQIVDDAIHVVAEKLLVFVIDKRLVTGRATRCRKADRASDIHVGWQP